MLSTTAAPSATAPARTPFVLAADAVAAVDRGHHDDGDTRLFAAVAPYEARAKADETISGAIGKVVAATYTLHREAAPKVPFVPRLDLLPLPPVDDGLTEVAPSAEVLALSTPLEAAAAAACAGGDDGGSALGGLPRLVLPPTPSGLTATEETMREVYHRAYLATRALARAEAVTVALSEHAAAVDVARRLLRKKSHVALRCGAAFYHAVALLSTIQEKWADAAVVATPTQPADAGRALLASVFNVAGEAALVHVAATALSLIGEVVVTAKRLVFYANTVGFRTRRNFGMDAIMYVVVGWWW